MADHKNGYPNSAGFNTETSQAGADAINPILPRLQRDVFAVIAAAGERGATGDEVASVLGWPKWRVRPRTSELRRAGKIGDSGKRRDSLAGISIIVWVERSRLGGRQ